MLKHPEADSLRSIKKCSEHPYKMWCVTGEYLEPFVKSENPNMHTLSYQMLPQVYIQNASIYITRPLTIYKYKSTLGNRVLNFIMDDMESVDINSELDFFTAESLLKMDV